MLKVLCLLSALFAAQVAVAALPAPVQGPNMVIGGKSSSTVSTPIHPGSVNVSAKDVDYFTLYTGVLSATTNAYYPFYKNGTAYSTHATKRTYCVSLTGQVGSASGGYQLMYDTATFAYAALVGALAAPKWQCGATAQYCRWGDIAANVEFRNDDLYEFPAGAVFPGAQFSDNTQKYRISLLCREQ